MNIKELADYLKLSTATVSKALNNKPDISTHTRKKVQDAARLLGYSPSAAARFLRSGKADSVALLLPTTDGDNILTAAFFMRIARGLQSSLIQEGIDPVIHIAADPKQEHRLLEKIIEQKRADAIILTDTRTEDDRITFLESLDFPFATMGQSNTLAGNFNWVDFNHIKAGHACVEHAVSKGAKRIAVVTLGQNSMHGEQFLAGCLQEMEAHGYPHDPGLYYFGDKTEQSGIRAVEQFMSLGEKPDFIIFINDFQLIGAHNALGSHSAKYFPTGNMICAIESSDFSSLILPDSCLFTINHHEIGEKLGLAVLDAIAGREPRHTLLDLQLKNSPAR